MKLKQVMCVERNISHRTICFGTNTLTLFIWLSEPKWARTHAHTLTTICVCVMHRFVCTYNFSHLIPCLPAYRPSSSNAINSNKKRGKKTLNQIAETQKRNSRGWCSKCDSRQMKYTIIVKTNRFKQLYSFLLVFISFPLSIVSARYQCGFFVQMLQPQIDISVAIDVCK